MVDRSSEAMDRKLADLRSVFLQLSDDIKSYCLAGDSVTELSASPESPLTFYRDYVSQNRPVIVRGGVKHWKAFREWQSDGYFRQKCGCRSVTVTLTPDGYADAIKKGKDGDDLFVMPHEMKMTVGELLDELQSPLTNRVAYYQMQNSNMTDDDEWSSLMDDVAEIDWAAQAFGSSPDAINFWMGDHRAVTSTHKDPYENIYCVVRGYKDITLFPPTDLPWLRYKSCRPAKYVMGEKHSFQVEELDEPLVPWIAVDPLNPDLEQFPEFVNASPVRLRLHAGDLLYLPSQWFHHLSQSQGCVAVNFWYDMQFDSKYVYNQMLSNLVKLNENNT